MSITHSKVSDKSDDADTTLVRPSDWNAAHTGEIPGADVPAVHAGSAHHTVESGQSATHTHAGHDTAHAHSATTGITATDHHSNANDHAQSHAHSAAGDGSTLTPAVLNIPNAAAPTPTAEGQVYWDNDDDKLVVGDGAGQKIIVPTASVSSDATMSTTGAVTIAATHSGSAHHAAYTHPNHSGDVTSVADGVQTIADAAVTLAKMANLTQDSFIGRTTASTGVPETATITAAARTVLDDTTVAAMVDTLGGAAATGTGGLARATSPTFVTPALGTPASGVLTNCTGLPEAGLVDDAVTLAKMAAGTDGNLITYDASGNPAAVATGNAGQVLTSNGAGAAPTFQAAAGGASPAMLIASDFPSAAKHITTVTGGGTVGYNQGFTYISTSATGTSSVDFKWAPMRTNGSGNMMVGSPVISCMMNEWGAVVGTDFNWFVGIGNASTPTITGSGITYTTDHVGFKSTRVGSGANNIHATQANGTTETASASLFTPAANDVLDLIIKVNSTTSVDYYTRQNGGALSAATNLTTNMPTAANIVSFHHQVSNVAVASNTEFNCAGASFQR